MFIVIPCYNEPEINYTLTSLFECDYPGVETGVIVVVNSSENSSEDVLIQNKKTIDELKSFSIEGRLGIQLFVIEVDNLPAKNGGVGWARKIGMDWAIMHFNFFGYDDGIILSLDADTVVEKNYLTSTYNYFKEHPKRVAATFYFEHTLRPSENNISDMEKASDLYELYMRYYRNAMIVTGFPNSIYTVGSCFAFTARAYVSQGGMNRRKAGEDFYFLHKMTLMGDVGEINTTTVYPSSRISSRVPFGTGPAIQKYCEGDHSLEYTFSLEAFEILSGFFSKIELLYKRESKLLAVDFSDNASFVQFCNENKLVDELNELQGNCGSPKVFRKRFFNLFNAFRILKWLNYSCQNEFPKSDLLFESQKLLKLMGIENEKTQTNPGTMLNIFRLVDKNRQMVI